MLHGSKFVVKQKMSKMEVAGDLAADAAGCPMCGECCETVNTYAVYDEAGTKVLKVKEDSTPCCRICCNPYHELRLKGKDAQTGQVMFTVDRPFKCHAIFPALCSPCQQEATVYGGDYQGPEKTPNAQIIGHIQQPMCGGCFSPELQTMDRPGEEPYATSKGPTCCLGGLSELCCDQTFTINDGSLGKIVHEKPESMGQLAQELVSDADLWSFQLADQSLAQPRRASMIATLLLLDYMFFENDKPWDLVCEDDRTYVNCTVCYIYLCGGFYPCKCKCPPASGEKDQEDMDGMGGPPGSSYGAVQ